MNNYDEILQLCVSTDDLRPAIKIPCRRNGKVIATNGHILVSMDDNLPEGEYGDNEYCESCQEWRDAKTKIILGSKKICGHVGVVKFPGSGGRLIGDALAIGNLNGTGGFFDLAAVESALAKYEKSPIYERISCREANCENGEIYCSYCRHYNTCDKCNGDGYIRTSNIIGESYEPNARIKIRESFFEAYYVSIIGKIMQLTGGNAEVVAQEENSATVLRIGAVDCLLMPIKHQHGSSEDFPVIELRKQ